MSVNDETCPWELIYVKMNEQTSKLFPSHLQVRAHASRVVDLSVLTSAGDLTGLNGIRSLRPLAVAGFKEVLPSQNVWLILVHGQFAERGEFFSSDVGNKYKISY